MTARFAIFAQDRSARWILVPGVASTRQIEIRNESDEAVECHLRVEYPQTASASPAVLTIQPHHTRSADIIFLANWSPQGDSSLLVSLRDPQGEQLATFSHELVAADSSDCALALDLKEPVVVDGNLAGFKLWFSIASKSPTPRRFEIDFVRHPSLRFPERTTVTLAPGEATAFEVPVEWNRAVRDLQFWNHPLKIEAFVPASHGRRTAVLSWETVERRLDKYLTDDDRVARIVPVQQQQPSATPTVLTPGQLKYTELVELKKLEQSVVGAAPTRVPVRPAEQPANIRASARWSTVATVATMAFAVVGLVLAALFFLRPPVVHPTTTPVHVAPPDMPTPVMTVRKELARTGLKHIAGERVATPVWTSVAATAAAQDKTVAVVDSSRETADAPAATPATVALAPVQRPAHHVVDRNAVVTLSNVDAAYAAGGRAVNVVWSGTAQAGATVQVLDFAGKIIASRDVRGDRSNAMIRLPRGYHGSVSVQVIALGYHGERVVQSASLGPRG